jgi:serine/threonine protein kinase
MVKQIGEFQLMERIGEGAYAKVRKAVHVKTKEIYAVKIIDREKLIDVHQTRQVEREIQVMLQMNHPGLIQLQTVLETPERWYMVLEYASGGELFEMLTTKGPFDEDTARNYFHQLVDAIDYMHERRAAHRDLKPENILFDHQGRLKVADFGFSIVANSQIGQLRSKCGTPSYAAPELFNPDSYAGPPADIWSMGVVLFAMLTGRLPFEGRTVDQLAEAIKRGNVKYPTNMPSDAVDLLRNIFVVDPAKRYRMSQIRDHPWFAKSYCPTVAIPTTNETLRRIESVAEHEIVPPTSVQIERMRENGNDCFPTAFELVARLLCFGEIAAFSANRSRRSALFAIQTLFDLHSVSVIEVRDVHSMILQCPSKSGAINLRLDVLPVDHTTVIVIGCPIDGSQHAFRCLFESIRQHVR